VAIYDVGTEEGLPYLVSELLEGATLRETLLDCPLSVRKAMEYALQIAEGLARAHINSDAHYARIWSEFRVTLPTSRSQYQARISTLFRWRSSPLDGRFEDSLTPISECSWAIGCVGSGAGSIYTLIRGDHHIHHGLCHPFGHAGS